MEAPALAYRRRAVIWALVVFVLAVLADAASDVAGSYALAGSLALLFGAVVFVATLLLAWRCPVCDRFLGRHLYPEACPHCGTSFH
jgi:rubrerythrin